MSSSDDSTRTAPDLPWRSAGTGMAIYGRTCAKCPGRHPNRGGGMFKNAAGQSQWFCLTCKAKRQ